MKKLLVLGLSACLLFSFTGSAFAASQTTTHVKKKVVHAAMSKKHAAHTLTTHAKKKVAHSAVSSKKPIAHAKKHAVSTSHTKVKTAVHKKTSAGQPQNA